MAWLADLVAPLPGPAMAASLDGHTRVHPVLKKPTYYFARTLHACVRADATYGGVDRHRR
jgi:hypothetical protein